MGWQRVWLVAAALIVWSPGASAHLPHDGARWVAAWPGVVDGPVLTTIYRSSGNLLARTWPGSARVDVRYIARQSDKIESAAMLAEPTVSASH